MSSDDYLRLLGLLEEEGFGSAELWDNWTNFVAVLWDKVMTGKNKVYATLQRSLAADEAPFLQPVRKDQPQRVIFRMFVHGLKEGGFIWHGLPIYGGVTYCSQLGLTLPVDEHGHDS